MSILNNVRQQFGQRQQDKNVGAAAPIEKPIPSYRPFPIHHLPDALGQFVRPASQSIGCDSSFIALPALAACSTMIGNSRRMRVKQNWFEPVTMWANVIGVSGTGKSPGHAIATDPVSEIEDDLRREYAAKVAEQKISESADDEEEPPLERVVTEDSTIEAVGKNLECSPRGMMLASEELGQWYQSFGRYSKSGSGYDPRWLGFWEAKPVRIDRVTGPSRYIPRAFLTVAGGIQPSVLRSALSANMYAGGLVARILYAMPPVDEIYWNDHEVSDAVKSNYMDLLKRLRGLKFDIKCGKTQPKLLMWNHESRHLFTEGYNELVREQSDAEDEHIRAGIGKLKNYLARFSALHHIVTYVANGENDQVDVGPESVQAARGLCRWFAFELRRVYGMLGASEAQDDINNLVEIIRRKKGRISARELQRSHGKKYATADSALAALERLVNSESARWHTEYPAGGGHPTLYAVLADTRTDNPTLDTVFQANGSDRRPVGLSAAHTGTNGKLQKVVVE